MDSVKLTEEAAQKLLQEEDERRRRRKRQGRLRELEEVRARVRWVAPGVWRGACMRGKQCSWAGRWG